MMEINNTPRTSADIAKLDEQHRAAVESQAATMFKLADLLEAGENPAEHMTDFELKLSVGRIRAAASDLKKAKRIGKVGGPKSIPDESILLRQVRIDSGMSISDAEKELADLYGVSQDTLNRCIRRLAEKISPTDWGFIQWGYPANKK